MPAFKIGEKALVIATQRATEPSFHQYIGTTVTVIGELEAHRGFCEPWVYPIRCFDGELCFAVPHVLQKIPPKREELGSWDLVPFASLIRQPKHVPA